MERAPEALEGPPEAREHGRLVAARARPVLVEDLGRDHSRYLRQFTGKSARRKEKVRGLNDVIIIEAADGPAAPEDSSGVRTKVLGALGSDLGRRWVRR